ncbi:hypothetical protein F8S13_22620 [Chloroflexia bacterium SDU3-3]|nr:hypothetical protein F8S13_22620 [Chloroflexia bacterium SDU3-3]
MATPNEIHNQQINLGIYRQTLADMLRQQAMQGTAYAQPALLATIRDSRHNIARIKGILRSWGIAADDHPDDTDPTLTPRTATPTPVAPAASFQFNGPIHAGNLNVGGTQTIQRQDITMGNTYNGGDNFSGSNFSGAIVNIRATLSNVTQSIGSLNHGSADDKQQLAALVEQLRDALSTAPADVQEDVEVVAEQTKDLLDKASKEKPNKKLVMISAEGLTKAAENLGAALPAVLSLVPQIILTVQKMLPA